MEKCQDNFLSILLGENRYYTLDKLVIGAMSGWGRQFHKKNASTHQTRVQRHFGEVAAFSERDIYNCNFRTSQVENTKLSLDSPDWALVL
jgi:hypothetical protein